MKKQKGFAVVFTLAMIGLVLLAGYVFFAVSSNGLRTSATGSDMMRAHYIAEAGVAKKFLELKSGNISPIGLTNFQLGTVNGTFQVAVNPQGGTFTAYKLVSTGKYKKAQRVISFTVSQQPISSYAYFSDNEDMLIWEGHHSVDYPVWFISGDILRGPLHTNDQLNISGDPVFEGPVTSTSSTINYYNGGPPADNPDFQSSLTLSAPAVQLPSQADMITYVRDHAALTVTADSGTDVTITLLSGGNMTVKHKVSGTWRTDTKSVATNSSVYVSDHDVYISGVLSGRLTVATTSNIVITGNILYNSDPATNPSSTDLLGLVSQNYVYIDSAASNNNPNHDLTVDAYIVALNSFTVESYDTGLKGTLTIYGGITQDMRGPIGTFNGSTGDRISGYSKDYNYDTRLDPAKWPNTLYPPLFPVVKDNVTHLPLYIKIVWNES